MNTELIRQNFQQQQRQIASLAGAIDTLVVMQLHTYVALDSLFEELFIDQKQEIIDTYNALRQAKKANDNATFEAIIQDKQHIFKALAIYEAKENLRSLLQALGVLAAPEQATTVETPQNKVIDFTPPKS